MDPMGIAIYINLYNFSSSHLGTPQLHDDLERSDKVALHALLVLIDGSTVTLFVEGCPSLD